MSGLEGGGLTGGGVGGSYQPGVYVPLKALFLVPLLLNSKISSFKLLAFFCDCIVWFVLDLVGNPDDCFSRVFAHFMLPSQLVQFMSVKL